MALNASDFALEDVISNMPDDVVTNILDRMPLQYAVRTSILSRKWRFKWTLLSQLVFNDKFFKYLLHTKGEKHHGSIISRLLVSLKSDITKSILHMQESSILDDEDITQWILLLSKKGIKALTLRIRELTKLNVSTHLFSCLQLKHLKLYNCYVHPPSSFHGFPNLLSLELSYVELESGGFSDLVSQSPGLEILKLASVNVKLAEIAKLKNLNMLSLSLYYLESTMIKSSNTIFELVGFLPKLQNLHLDFFGCELTEVGAKKTSRVVFPFIKTLKLSDLDLGNSIELSCALKMIRRFSSLQNLEITSTKHNASPFPQVEYSTIRLRSVVITCFKGLENEVCFIKYILACSPFLEKIVIYPEYILTTSDRLTLTMKLLKLHRASLIAEIDFTNVSRYDIDLDLL